MNLTQLLAVWGAIVSSVAITWNVFRDIGDKGKLKIDAMIGKMYPDYTDRDYLFITITNIGRRPVMVKGWGGRKKKSIEGKRGLFIIPRGLPCMLKEGEYHTEYSDDLSIISPELEGLHVWDSHGNEWKVSRKNFKRLLKEMEDIDESKS